jgi:hypothetical protein
MSADFWTPFCAAQNVVPVGVSKAVLAAVYIHTIGWAIVTSRTQKLIGFMLRYRQGCTVFRTILALRLAKPRTHFGGALGQGFRWFFYCHYEGHTINIIEQGKLG